MSCAIRRSTFGHVSSTVSGLPARTIKRLLGSYFSDSFINRVRIHSPSSPWHRKPCPGKGHPSHSWDAIQTGFSVCAGGPVWERYSGLVLFGLELACAGFFTFDLHFLRCLFRHGIIVWENEKAVLPEIGERLGKDADGQRPFENKKPGFSRLLRLKKSRLIHKW